MARRNVRWMPRSRRHPGRKALAYHEAGHAVIGYALGLEIEQITIIPNETSLGQCRYRGWETSGPADDLDSHLRLILAGAVAEEIAMGAPSRGSDERRALDLALLRSDSEAEAAERVDAARSLIARFLEEHWPVVKALAAALRRDRELDGPEAMGALRRAFRKVGVCCPPRSRLQPPSSFPTPCAGNPFPPTRHQSG